MNNIRQKINLQKHSFVIGNCGDLKKEEDQASILKALRKLLAKEINAELLLIGEGPLHMELKNMAEKFNIAHAVHFVRNKISEAEFFDICDALIFSGFAQPDLEPVYKAAKAEKPIIATKITGYRDLIKDNKTGFLVPCGFPERIEAAIKKLEASADLKEKMGKAGNKCLHHTKSIK